MPPVNHAIAEAGIVAISAAIAAAVAMYESPDLRRHADEVRRRVAHALHLLGDGINPPDRPPLFNRPEDAYAYLQAQGREQTREGQGGPSSHGIPGVDADDESRRRQREELMYWNSIREQRERERREFLPGVGPDAHPEHAPGIPSFDDFLRRDDSAGESGAYVFNSGADVGVPASSGLVYRRGGEGTRVPEQVAAAAAASRDAAADAIVNGTAISAPAATAPIATFPTTTTGPISASDAALYAAADALINGTTIPVPAATAPTTATGPSTSASYAALYAAVDAAAFGCTATSDPFADENRIAEDAAATPSATLRDDETDLFSADGVEVRNDARADAELPPTPERRPAENRSVIAGGSDRGGEPFDAIQAWARNSQPPFYSPLPEFSPGPVSEPEVVSDFEGHEDGQLTPTDSASIADVANDAVSSGADVLSESEGMATPASWSEVGSVISDGENWR